MGNFGGEEASMPLKNMLPMADPNDIVFAGWDISGMPLDKALDWKELRFFLKTLKMGLLFF